MPRLLSALLAAPLMLTLAACDDRPCCTAPSAAGAMAPPIPAGRQSKVDFEALTGIRSDAVAAITGTPNGSYVYYDPFAAPPAAVEAAPAHLCAQHGKALKESYITEPEDHMPGMKVLVITCQ
ncbi:hypothetical protein [Rhodobacter aestuarii]|nr:hypothetical protein [Rhodobacter aestuarii]